MATPEITKNTSNPFDAPIPGQSLTDTPGNYPWEHPPQYTDLNTAAEYVWDILHEENKLEQVLLILKSGVSVEAIARGILFTGFVDGKWTVDLAMLLAEIVFNQVLALGIKAKIKNIKVLSSDNSNAEFRKEYGKLMVSKEKKEEGIKEIKEDIKQLPETMGLMAKIEIVGE
jgi:hypothetical protein|tara:strand:+ start:368 stop:883 length:516 start_codon:yes stop_codon:yes gene_type:complete